jgi:hypothetical protein
VTGTANVRSGRSLTFAMEEPLGRASDLAVFRQLHELILIQEQFAKTHAQHWWAQVLSGMGFPE